MGGHMRKHAPAGGTVKADAAYKGGQFLPDADSIANLCAKRKTCYGCPIQRDGKCPSV